jgi:hypothetical protein
MKPQHSEQRFMRLPAYLAEALCLALLSVIPSRAQSTMAGPALSTEPAPARDVNPRRGLGPHDPYSPAVLPGKGLAQYDLLVFGENDTHRMEQTISVVRGGRVVWTYSIPRMDHGQGEEIGDAYMLPNGNILFARQHGASIVTPQKKIVWNYDAPPDATPTSYFPKNAEIHAIEPAGKDRVMLVINESPMSKLLIVNTKSNAVEKTVELPCAKVPVHLHFRRVQLTPTGTILAGHLDEGKVSEYDLTGREIWSVESSKPWFVRRLANGNTLIGGDGPDGSYIHEVNPQKQIVWEFSQKDTAIAIFQLDEAMRLPNGNTLIANWSSHIPAQDWPQTVQELEVTPDKRVVWALRSWDPPNDLGPVSGVRLLEHSRKIAKLYPVGAAR